jgi:hypothetical protein
MSLVSHLHHLFNPETCQSSIEFIPMKHSLPTESGHTVRRCQCRNLLFPRVSEAW